ncbi:MAG: hypothetical protein GY835_05630 [bacterium]|nr:hypothetical protein [bacterium]
MQNVRDVEVFVVELEDEELEKLNCEPGQIFHLSPEEAQRRGTALFDELLPNVGEQADAHAD